MKLLRFLLPTLKIHCWGGIGSQLGAYCLFSELKVRGERRVKLVLHSSGITRRDDCDFKELFPHVKYDFIDDYKAQNLQTPSSATFLSNYKNRLSNFTKELIKQILNMSRIVVFSEVNSSSDLLPWTVGVRCAYSNLLVSETAVFEINKSLRIWSTSIQGPNYSGNEFQVVCHYRLGDLLDIETKTYISPQALSLLIDEIYQKNTVTGILILTENPEFAETNLSDLLNVESSINFRNPEVLRVLWLGVSAPFFVGTNSKVSTWISLLRAQNLMSHKSTFLPLQMKQGLKNIWPGCDTFVDFF